MPALLRSAWLLFHLVYSFKGGIFILESDSITLVAKDVNFKLTTMVDAIGNLYSRSLICICLAHP